MGANLHTLIRLSKWNVDEKRRALSALYAREDQVLTQIRNHQAELAAEQANVKVNMAAATTWTAFYEAHRRRSETLDRQLRAVRKEIEAARDDLAEAYRELKSFETAQAGRDRREQQERDRKERIFLDELGQQRHQRRKEEG